MTKEEAIHIYENCRLVTEFFTEEAVTAAYIEGLAALRAQQEAESPKPLTLDELREMDGEPVWIVEYPDWGHWELSEDAQDYIADRDTDFYGMRHDDPCGRYGLHKLGWLTYRHKPKEYGDDEKL